MSSLQDRLDKFKKTFESGAPPYNASREAVETMHRATDELKASGVEARALKVGDRAPGFTLFNQNHAQAASADLLREGPLVASFFRGHWRPYCNMELEALQMKKNSATTLGWWRLAICLIALPCGRIGVIKQIAPHSCYIYFQRAFMSRMTHSTMPTRHINCPPNLWMSGDIFKLRSLRRSGGEVPPVRRAAPSH